MPDTIVLTDEERAALAAFLGGEPLTDREYAKFVHGWESVIVNGDGYDPNPRELNDWGRAIFDAAKVSLEAFLTVPAARPPATTFEAHLWESNWLGDHDSKTDREYVASVAGYYAATSGFRCAERQEAP